MKRTDLFRGRNLHFTPQYTPLSQSFSSEEKTKHLSDAKLERKAMIPGSTHSPDKDICTKIREIKNSFPLIKIDFERILVELAEVRMQAGRAPPVAMRTDNQVKSKGPSTRSKSGIGKYPQSDLSQKILALEGGVMRLFKQVITREDSVSSVLRSMGTVSLNKSVDMPRQISDVSSLKYETGHKWDLIESEGRKISSTESELKRALLFRVQELEKLNNDLLKDLREANSKLVQARLSGSPGSPPHSIRAGAGTYQPRGSDIEYSLFKENQELQEKISRLSDCLSRVEIQERSPSELEKSQQNEQRLLSKLKQANDCIYKFLSSLQKLQKGAIKQDESHMPTYRKEFDAHKVLLIEFSRDLKTFVNSYLNSDPKFPKQVMETRSSEIIELTRQFEKEMEHMAAERNEITKKLSQITEIKNMEISEEIKIVNLQLQKKQQELMEFKLRSDTQTKELQNEIAILKQGHSLQNKKILEEQKQKLALYEKNELILKKRIIDLEDSLHIVGENSHLEVKKAGLKKKFNLKWERMKRQMLSYVEKLATQVSSMNRLRGVLEQKMITIFNEFTRVSSLISKGKDALESRSKRIKELESKVQSLQKSATDQTASLNHNLSFIKSRSEQVAKENSCLQAELLSCKLRSSQLEEELILEKEAHEEYVTQLQSAHKKVTEEYQTHLEKYRGEFMAVVSQYEVQLKERKECFEDKPDEEMIEMAGSTMRRNNIFQNEEWKEIQTKNFNKSTETLDRQIFSVFEKVNERINLLNEKLKGRKNAVKSPLANLKKALLIRWKKLVNHNNIDIDTKLSIFEEKFESLIHKYNRLSVVLQNASREKYKKLSSKITSFFSSFPDCLTKVKSKMNLEYSKIENILNFFPNIHKRIQTYKTQTHKLAQTIADQKQVHQSQLEELNKTISELSEKYLLLQKQNSDMSFQSENTILALKKQIVSLQEIFTQEIQNKTKKEEIMLRQTNKIKKLASTFQNNIFEHFEIEAKFSEKNLQITQLYKTLNIFKNKYSKQKERLSKFYEEKINDMILEKNHTISILQEQVQKNEKNIDLQIKELSQIHKQELDQKVSEINTSFQLKIKESENDNLKKEDEFCQLQEELIEKNTIICELKNKIKENEEQYFNKLAETNKKLDEKKIDIYKQQETIANIYSKFSENFNIKIEMETQLNTQLRHINKLQHQIVELKAAYSERSIKQNSLTRKHIDDVIIQKNTEISELFLQIEKIKKISSEQLVETEIKFNNQIKEKEKTHTHQFKHIKEIIKLFKCNLNNVILQTNNSLGTKLEIYHNHITLLSDRIHKISNVILTQRAEKQKILKNRKHEEVKLNLLEIHKYNKEIHIMKIELKNYVSKVQEKYTLFYDNIKKKLSDRLIQLNKFSNLMILLNTLYKNKIIQQQELVDSKIKLEATKYSKLQNIFQESEFMYLNKIQHLQSCLNLSKTMKLDSENKASEKLQERVLILFGKFIDHITLSINNQNTQTTTLKNKIQVLKSLYYKRSAENSHKFELQLKEKDRQIALLANNIHDLKLKHSETLKEEHNSYNKELNSLLEQKNEEIEKLHTALENNKKYAQELRDKILLDNSSLTEGNEKVNKLLEEKAKSEDIWFHKLENQQIEYENKITKLKNVVSILLPQIIQENYKNYCEKNAKQMLELHSKIESLSIHFPQIQEKLLKYKDKIIKMQHNKVSAVKLQLQQFSSKINKQYLDQTKIFLGKIDNIVAVVSNLHSTFKQKSHQQLKSVLTKFGQKIVTQYSSLLTKLHYSCEKQEKSLTWISGLIPQVDEAILSQRRKLIESNKMEIELQKSSDKIESLQSLLKAADVFLINSKQNSLQKIKLILTQCSDVKTDLERLKQDVCYSSIDSLRVCQTTIKNQFVQLQNELGVYRERITALEKKLDYTSELFKTNEEKQEQISSENICLKSKLNEKEKEIAGSQNIVVSLIAQQKDLIPLVENFKNNVVELKSRFLSEMKELVKNLSAHSRTITAKSERQTCEIRQQLSEAEEELQTLRDSETKHQIELQSLKTKLVSANKRLQKSPSHETETFSENSKYSQLLKDYEMDKAYSDSKHKVYEEKIAISNKEIAELKSQLAEERMKVDCFRKYLRSQIEQIKFEAENTNKKEIAEITVSITEKSKQQRAIFKQLRGELVQFKKWMTLLLEEMRKKVIAKSNIIESMAKNKIIQFKTLQSQYFHLFKQYFNEVKNPSSLYLEKIAKLNSRLLNISKVLPSDVKGKIQKLRSSVADHRAVVSQQLLTIEKLEKEIQRLQESQSSIQSQSDSEIHKIEGELKKTQDELSEKKMLIESITQNIETERNNFQSAVLELQKKVDNINIETVEFKNKLEETEKQNENLRKSLLETKAQLEESKAKVPEESSLLDLNERKSSSSSISASSAAGRHHSASHISSPSEREKMLRSLKAMIMKFIQMIPINKIKALDQLVQPLGSLLGLTKEEIASMEEERKKAKLDSEIKPSSGLFGLFK